MLKTRGKTVSVLYSTRNAERQSRGCSALNNGAKLRPSIGSFAFAFANSSSVGARSMLSAISSTVFPAGTSGG